MNRGLRVHFLDEGALEQTSEVKMGSNSSGASVMQGCISGIRAVKGQDVGTCQGRRLHPGAGPSV